MIDLEAIKLEIDDPKFISSETTVYMLIRKLIGEIERLHTENATWRGTRQGYQDALAEVRQELEQLRAQLDEVRSVVRSGIPIDREDALAAWRRLEAACQIYGA